MLPPRPYPITATSVVTAVGVGREAHIEAFLAGRSGLSASTASDSVETYLGRIMPSLPSLPASLSSYDTRPARILQLLLSELDAQLCRACQRWGPARVAMVLGSSNAGVARTEVALGEFVASGSMPADYSFERQHTFGALLRVVQESSDVRGPAWVISTACSSSAKALGSARRLLDSRLADCVLVVGVDSLCELTLQGFSGLGLTSKLPCRPFSSERDGLNLGEGGAMILVEREGDGMTELWSVGESSDAHHMNSPCPDGSGAALAMSRALHAAGIASEAIGFVQAHGTGTLLNDLAESRAVGSLLGAKTPVVSSKGFTGHLLGACGAVEAVFTSMALELGWLPGSLGAEPLDDEIHLNVNPSLIECPATFALSNSFGFGGSNASVLLGRRGH